jgi:hypothetical protein
MSLKGTALAGPLKSARRSPWAGPLLCLLAGVPIMRLSGLSRQLRWQEVRLGIWIVIIFKDLGILGGGFFPRIRRQAVSADNCRYSRRVSCRSRIPGTRFRAKGWLQRLPRAGRLSRSRLRGLPHHGAIGEAGRTCASALALELAHSPELQTGLMRAPRLSSDSVTPPSSRRTRGQDAQ